MSNNEQELKLTDIARENDNEGKKTESIADILRRNKEEQVGQIESFNFADIGYTEKKLNKTENSGRLLINILKNLAMIRKIS